MNPFTLQTLVLIRLTKLPAYCFACFLQWTHPTQALFTPFEALLLVCWATHLVVEGNNFFCLTWRKRGRRFGPQISIVGAFDLLRNNTEIREFLEWTRDSRVMHIVVDFHSAERSDGLSTHNYYWIWTIVQQTSHLACEQRWTLDSDFLYSNESNVHLNMTCDNVYRDSVPIKHRIASHLCHKCLNTHVCYKGTPLDLIALDASMCVTRCNVVHHSSTLYMTWIYHVHCI